MKKIIGILIFISMSITSLNAIDVVSNKSNIYIQTEDRDIRGEDLKGHFTFLWFYDVNCHYCSKSIPELMKVLEFIDNNHSDDIEVIMVSVIPRKFSVLDNYLEKHGLLNEVTSGRVGNQYMNKYMNVNATPTMIILDPSLSIVDKIENVTVASIYARHIDIIMQKYYESMETYMDDEE